MTNRTIHLIPISLIGVLIAGAFNSESVWAQAGRTVMDGVYSASQATQGETAYKANCVNCHGLELRGGGGGAAPTLRTAEFIDRWREDSLVALFNKLKTMPRNSPGKLDEPTYLSLLTFILQANEFPTGAQDLSVTNLQNIRVTGKEGPKPLPNNTQVSTVGCLTGKDDEWTISKAMEPVRNRKPGEASPEELQQFGNTPLGELTFQARNIDLMDPPFDPAPHNGHKMLIKGVMVRTATGARISVNYLGMLSATCQ